MAARLAQSVEHQTFNLRVKGSSPLSGLAIFLLFLIVRSTEVLIHFFCIVYLTVHQILNEKENKKNICQKWDSNPRPQKWTATWTQRLRPLGHPDIYYARELNGDSVF